MSVEQKMPGVLQRTPASGLLHLFRESLLQGISLATERPIRNSAKLNKFATELQIAKNSCSFVASSGSIEFIQPEILLK